MRNFVLFGLMLSGIHVTYAVTHSWKAFSTGSTGLSEFPEFVSVGMVDDVLVVYFDSRASRFQHRQKWMEENLGQEYAEWQTNILKSSMLSFKANVGTLMQRFNQSGGVHTLQWMYGCEWDDETGTTDGFQQFGYDGEDFIAFDMKNMRWIAPLPQGGITKHKWDSNRALNEQTKNYLTQTCIEWLKKYVGYGRSTLERKVPPEVSLLQRDPSSPVTCYATGFFPSGIVVSWQKNGRDLQGDVELGETLPNEDGSFQIMSHLRVKPEDWKKDTYTCIVQHNSLKEDIVKTVCVEEIWTNQENSPPVAIIIGVVVAVLLVAVIAIVGFLLWRRKSKPVSDGGSRSSVASDDSHDSTKELLPNSK